MMALRGSQEGGRKVGGIAFNEPLAAGSIFIAVDSFIHTYTQIHSRGGCRVLPFSHIQNASALTQRIIFFFPFFKLYVFYIYRHNFV
jgi:hypothetical protein